MNFEYPPKVQALRQQLEAFVERYLLPYNAAWHQSVTQGVYPPPFVADLKELARSEGLWNLFLPGLREDEPGTRLSNQEYAPLAEIMGRLPWGSEVFNCSAPDTGNMELLHLFGTPEQNRQWLHPLLEGTLRSAFAMSEPDVASSDPTNLQTTMRHDGEQLVLNGRKWFITGAAHPACKLLIVMCRNAGNDSGDNGKHHQHSMVLVPMDTPGLTLVRNIPIMQHHSPEGHCEILLRDVRVPASHMLGQEGEGFAMAQARLGPGRIHHCMRSLGIAERALELMCQRAVSRSTFGSPIARHGVVQEWIAESRLRIEQARLLVLKTAWLIDTVGAKGARTEVAAIKVAAPRAASWVVDKAIQVHGAAGVSGDTPLAEAWAQLRTLHLADGPDEVHLRSIARQELRPYAAKA